MNDILSKEQLMSCKRASHILCSKTIHGKIYWVGTVMNDEKIKHFSQGLLTKEEFYETFDKSKFSDKEYKFFEENAL